jgi:hypothetical protein
MWSGPRNISTALMRSFGSRPDTHVSDEPLYAHYLASTGLPHPMADEIVRTHEADWRKVAAELTGPTPSGETVWYQKHMAHHLLPEIERGWLAGFRHAFLLREPRAMLASLVDRLGSAELKDTGLPQQVEIHRWVRETTGEAPPVVDSADIQADPAGVLAKLCDALGIEYDDAMLSWEPGPKGTDGCWGPHWYQSTYRSTGFSPPVTRGRTLDPAYEDLARECEALYEELAAHRITTDTTHA